MLMTRVTNPDFDQPAARELEPRQAEAAQRKAQLEQVDHLIPRAYPGQTVAAARSVAPFPQSQGMIARAPFHERPVQTGAGSAEQDHGDRSPESDAYSTPNSGSILQAAWKVKAVRLVTCRLGRMSSRVIEARRRYCSCLLLELLQRRLV